jgi:hypothetical protein
MPWITTPIVLALTLALAQGSEPRVTHIEGSVSLSPDGIRTAGGRAELVLANGTLVHVDGASRVGFERAGELTLSEGRLLLRTGNGLAFDLGVPYARLRLSPSGVYSVLADASRGRLLVSVIAGRIDLQTRYGQSVLIPVGHMVLMTNATSAPWATPFQPAGWDRFELWSDARFSAAAWQAGSASHAAIAESGVVLNTHPASPTCSSWMTVDNPCWLLPASPSTHPGVPPYRPGPPAYAPRYRPNYTPNYNVPPAGLSPGSSHPPSTGRPEQHGPGGGAAQPPPSARPNRSAGRPRPTPPSSASPPAPAATPNPAARGTGGGVRVPERPRAQGPSSCVSLVRPA